MAVSTDWEAPFEDSMSSRPASDESSVLEHPPASAPSARTNRTEVRTLRIGPPPIGAGCVMPDWRKSVAGWAQLRNRLGVRGAWPRHEPVAFSIKATCGCDQ